jgi:Transposase DDE domain
MFLAPRRAAWPSSGDAAATLRSFAAIAVLETRRLWPRNKWYLPSKWAALARTRKLEMLFAHLKRILRLNRLRLRGPSGAKDEFLLAAIAQNFRKLAKLVGGPATGVLAAV